LSADGELPDGCRQIDVERVFGREQRQPRPGGRPIEQRRPRRPKPEHDVLDGGEGWHQHEVLVDHPNPEADGGSG
jgi:hypothetical protein